MWIFNVIFRTRERLWARHFGLRENDWPKICFKPKAGLKLTVAQFVP